MNCSEIIFRVKTANYEDIVEHLLACADIFNPPLYTYVNIEEYAHKLYVNAVTFEAWDRDKLIGLVAAYYNDDISKIGFVSNVSILDKYRGYGIAHELIRHTIEFGKKHAFNRLDLEVIAGNTKALKLYTRNGFFVTEQKKGILRMSRSLKDELIIE